MDKDHLNERLKLLNFQLEQTNAADEAGREALQNLIQEIQALRDQPAEDSVPNYQAVLEKAQLALGHFQVSHPALALAINEAITALVNVGV